MENSIGNRVASEARVDAPFDHSLVRRGILGVKRNPVPGERSILSTVLDRCFELRDACEVGSVRSGLKSVQLSAGDSQTPTDIDEGSRENEPFP